MSHKKFGADRVSRFDVYWIQTDRQTNRQTDRQAKLMKENNAKMFRQSLNDIYGVDKCIGRRLPLIQVKHEFDIQSIKSI